MLKKESMLALLVVVLMSSCVTRKELTAFRTVTAETAEEVNKTLKPQPEPRVKINDALIITVSGLDPEAVIPYNLPTVSYESPASSTVPTTSSFQYYTVDEQGYIDFPVLGKLYVVGLRQSEVINLIESKLQGQVVNPIVTMRFLNARVTVLGEVKRPGTFTLNNGRMTLLEALGIAGDLTQYANRSNVLITRENNGKVEFARLDLRSDEVFTSPYFYLQQNDVVYVEPNQARTTSNQSIGLWLSMVGTVASAATVVVSVLAIQNNGEALKTNNNQ
ncbi:MAG: polysaccharide biosynthesis/export family protein [Paludibacteraceae bacterium]|nr:polysaccharide biosynthesis/export family protein [Paludibacteraceae bacterium]